ncbi:hypothetical protein Mal4_15870 [Maioricimonas rarisocia]|uniref:TadE-like domain-containing protein n=1 Tax=Maioricimonas rarisocia TaxID=2528026 RepID=A0A517Z4C7_9PLAN|nr:TadE/TadG family type IV pilus assembly protein [Maioricimonas rarisocia]QDU37277.1 hypothetical protein Mal4_15870 [Maioricimonas rarisocia]
MHRAVVHACFPCLAALAVAFLVAVLVVRLSGARFNLPRLRSLHSCQDGGVQSLAFVLALPLFLMIVMFIVQVSQLMVGIMVVNYAAYASARAASVWIPALVDDRDFMILDVDGDGDAEDDSQNKLPIGFEPGVATTLDLQNVSSSGSGKLEKIFSAAVLACAPIAPSRALASVDRSVLDSIGADEVMREVYTRLAPSSTSNSRIGQRIDNKLAYSLQNTRVTLLFEDKNSSTGPTYNPQGHDWGWQPQFAYYPNEVGWEDPVTITVTHDFALLPGAGGFLAARLLNRADGREDRVSPRIATRDGFYSTRLQASATMTIEGIQSVKPYIHEDW